jgi:hypothetical protein
MKKLFLVLLLVAPACGETPETTDNPGGTGGGGPGGGEGSTGGGGDGGDGGAGGTELGPPPGNALWLDGAALPLYPVSDPTAGTRAVAFRLAGSSVTAYEEDGAVWWEKDVGPGSLFGGFDFDADGVPDLGLVRTEDTGVPCGSQTILKTGIDVASGRTGEVFALVPPEESICWDFSGTIYPTHQWSGLGVLFGSASNELATSAYYATSGQFWKWNGAGFDEVGVFQFPSTSAYDAAYTADQPNPYGQGYSYVQSSHAANGLLVAAGGETRLAFFTSARAAAYAPGPLAPDQLRMDVPYLTGDRTDIAGRNYGLVAVDPGAPSHLVLIAGTSADTMYSDMTTGTMEADPWGQIERHVSIVDLETGAVEDRFFSYAHDNGDGNQYEGRVVYPNGAFVRQAGGPSRLAFNVYEGGHWMLHVTQPGSTADEVVYEDLFLWDIRDLDGDGHDEWVLSPSRDPEDPDVPGYYFVKWRTVLGYWSDVLSTWKESATLEGAIPMLVPAFRSPELTTSRGFLYPTLTTRAGGPMELLLVGADGTPMTYTVSPVF